MGQDSTTWSANLRHAIRTTKHSVVHPTRKVLSPAGGNAKGDVLILSDRVHNVLFWSITQALEQQSGVNAMDRVGQLTLAGTLPNIVGFQEVFAGTRSASGLFCTGLSCLGRR